jgi:hypothetical protein
VSPRNAALGTTPITEGNRRPASCLRSSACLAPLPHRRAHRVTLLRTRTEATGRLPREPSLRVPHAKHRHGALRKLRDSSHDHRHTPAIRPDTPRSCTLRFADTTHCTSCNCATCPSIADRCPSVGGTPTAAFHNHCMRSAKCYTGVE